MRFSRVKLKNSISADHTLKTTNWNFSPFLKYPTDLQNASFKMAIYIWSKPEKSQKLSTNLDFCKKIENIQCA